MKGLRPTEVEFAWKLSQDMLLIGRRIHRANVDKECKNDVGGAPCVAIPDVMHTFVQCNGIIDQYNDIKNILQQILDCDVQDREVITLSFTHRNTKRRKIAVWFIVKALNGIYQKKGNEDIFREIVKELEWFLQVQIKVGSCQEMIRAKDIVKEYRNGIG